MLEKNESEGQENKYILKYFMLGEFVMTVHFIYNHVHIYFSKLLYTVYAILALETYT